MVFVDWAKNLFILFDGGKTTDYFLELLQTRGITSCSNIYRKFLLEANLRYTTIKVLRRFDVELQNYTEIRRRAKFQKKKTQKPILGTQRSCCSSNENVKCKRQKSNDKVCQTINVKFKYKCQIETSSVKYKCQIWMSN